MLQAPRAWNPLLEGLQAGGDRRELTARYAFGIPDDHALGVLADAAPPAGIVEVGAGLGYWARLLTDRGVDVAAYDLHPPPSPENQNFAGVDPWHPVLEGDHTAVDAHPDRLLLFVWPTPDEDWPAAALDRFGGELVAYVGGDPGSVTGDDRFHKLLGNLDGCPACDLGVTNAPCLCAVEPAWHVVAEHDLPRWPGDEDVLRLYRRGPATRRRRPPRWFRP